MEKDRQVGEKRPSAVVFETMDATGASKGQVRGNSYSFSKNRILFVEKRPSACICAIFVVPLCREADS